MLVVSVADGCCSMKILVVYGGKRKQYFAFCCR